MYHTKKYVILNYAMSWGFFALVIAFALVFNLKSMLEGDNLFKILITVIYCWMPNIVLLLFWKKLTENRSLKDFYRNELKVRIKWTVLLGVLLVQVLVCLLSALFVSVIDHSSFWGAFGLPAEGVLVSAVYCLFTGATGEESGWRGFLLKGYLQKHNLLVSSIFTGIVWAIWHLPMWILSEYKGIQLMEYIGAFGVCTICFTIIMMYFYDKCRNIIVLVFFHYMINFVLSFYQGNDLLYQVFTAAIYAVTAAILVLMNQKLYLKKGNSLEA